MVVRTGRVGRTLNDLPTPVGGILEPSEVDSRTDSRTGRVSSFVSYGGEGIDSGGAPGWNIAGN
jgi:hypothetical protein